MSEKKEPLVKKKQASELNEPSLIGRDEIIAQILESLSQMHEKVPRFLLLSGGQGIGKSRVCKEIQERAQEDPKETFFLESTCKAEDEQNEFIRAMQIVFQLYTRHGLVPKRNYVGNFPSALSPDFVEFALAPLTEESMIDVFSSVESDNEKINAAVSSYVRSHAQEKSICLVLDNLHLIDRRTGDWLLQLCTSLSQGDRLVIIGMYRGDQASGENNFQRILPRFRMAPHFKEIKLSPIIPRDTISLIRSAVGPVQIDQSDIMMFYRATRGVPYLMLDLIREMAEEGKITWQDGAWGLAITSDILKICSKGAEDLLIQNYGKLGKNHQSILEWLTISSFAMTPEDLCTLTGLKNVQLPYILGDLMKERYIFEEDEKNKAYSLSSIRMGKTILSKIEEKRVFKMHIQVARMLEKQHQKDDMWMKAADHYYHGKETGKTLHLSLEVARWLMTQKRFSMALRYYKRAMVEARENKKNMVCPLLIELGYNLYRLGDYNAALAHFQEAISLTSKQEEEIKTKRGKGLCLYGLARYDQAYKELRSLMTLYKRQDSEILLTLASLENYRMNIKKSTEYLDHARETLVKFPEADILAPILKRNEGWVCYYRGDWKTARESLEEAEKLSLELQDNQNMMQASLCKSYLIADTQGIVSAWKALHPVLAYARDTDDFALQFLANYQAGIFYLEQMDVEKALGHFSQVEIVSKKKGADREAGYALLGNGLCLFSLKEAAEKVEKAAQDALDIANTFGDQFLGAKAYHLLAKVYRRSQKLGASQKYLDYSKGAFLALELKWMANRLFNDYARLFTLAQKSEQANRYLEEAEKNCLETGDQHCLADTYFERAFLLAQNRQTEEARKMFEWAEQMYERLGRKGGVMEARENKLKK